MDCLRYGATLYVPATRADLPEVAGGLKYPALRTVVICTEDSVAEGDLPLALANLRKTLPALGGPGPLRFVRPRNPAVLREIMSMPQVSRLDGLVLPKADSRSMPAFLGALGGRRDLELMPILETALAFDQPALLRFRDYLLGLAGDFRVAALRVGALDLLALLGLRRSLSSTIHESAIGPTISLLLTVFRPAGLELCATGFEGLDHPDLLARELGQDLDRGLFAKTAVHPGQIEPIHRAYRPSPDDFALALALTDPKCPAVFRHGDRMCEKAVHSAWARGVLRRAEIFGLGQAAAPIFAHGGDPLARPKSPILS
ncbi:MAG: HpcH/HpaI aldolase/citrate lyase family protein [Deltaproteobacteria bacterium]|jgi:citrate lyase beta subunit|nr:HpcH/HpaI aldolase/citrate lyase family protein [Deltaproteobacteria bacterium]